MVVIMVIFEDRGNILLKEVIEISKNILNKFLNILGLELKRIKSEETKKIDERWFEKRLNYKSNYSELLDALDVLINFEDVLDLGSANGFVIDKYVAKGKHVQGVEISKEVMPFLSDVAKQRTVFCDATLIGKIGDFDLVTCIEVAEHIPPERSNALMDVIAKNASKYVYFTAATPYQKGTGHINCMPHFFWLNGFRKRGLELNYDLTEMLVDKINNISPCTWLPLNSLILNVSEKK